MTDADRDLEAQIQAAGLTAPRVHPDDIDDLVRELSFHTYVIPGTTVTVAAAIAPGNFVVALGEAGAASAANFNEAIGRNRAISRARDAARLKLWELEGYRLKRNLLDVQEAGGLEHVLKMAKELPNGERVWPVVAIPAAVICQSQKACGWLRGDPSLCGCPGGLCATGIEVSELGRCECDECRSAPRFTVEASAQATSAAV